METTSQPTIDEILQSEQLSTLREGLRRKKLTRPTLLQQAFWPVISYGINKKTSDVDFILTAPTGTGKTLTFLVAAIGWLIIEQEKITSEMVKNEAIISPAKPG
jgi:superfamily II DNA/RNA helicase